MHCVSSCSDSFSHPANKFLCDFRLSIGLFTSKSLMPCPFFMFCSVEVSHSQTHNVLARKTSEFPSEWIAVITNTKLVLGPIGLLESLVGTESHTVNRDSCFSWTCLKKYIEANFHKDSYSTKDHHRFQINLYYSLIFHTICSITSLFVD